MADSGNMAFGWNVMMWKHQSKNAYSSDKWCEQEISTGLEISEKTTLIFGTDVSDYLTLYSSIFCLHWNLSKNFRKRIFSSSVFQCFASNNKTLINKKKEAAKLWNEDYPLSLSHSLSHTHTFYYAPLLLLKSLEWKEVSSSQDIFPVLPTPDPLPPLNHTHTHTHTHIHTYT